MTTPIIVCAECGARNPAHVDRCTQCDMPLNGLLITTAAEITGQAYTELLMAVERKFPGESRHQTALRYIREAEARANEAGPAKMVHRWSRDRGAV